MGKYFGEYIFTEIVFTPHLPVLTVILYQEAKHYAHAQSIAPAAAMLVAYSLALSDGTTLVNATANQLHSEV